MDIYNYNDRRKHPQSPTSLGRLAKKEEKRYSPAQGIQGLTLQRSPSQIISSQITEAPHVVQVSDGYLYSLTLDKDISKVLRTINKSKLADVVRKSLRREKYQIKGWRVQRLDGGVGNPVSLGLYRFEGTGADRDTWIDWSVVLKMIQSPANLGRVNIGEGEDPSHWNYWKRELLVYQSGWLETLPEGLNAPQCFDAMELPGNTAALWLEDISDSYSGNWSLYRYALAARHLGRLNGIYTSRRELPSFSWFGKYRTRQWLEMVPWQNIPWDHPKVQLQFPSGEENSFRRMLMDHQRFLDRLDQLPKSVSHGDTFPTNLKSRRLDRGREQTVALDWALTGIEPIGDDLGQLVYGTWLNLKGYKLQDISQTLFASYMNGLQDKYSHLDPELVKFGYTASAAFRVGLFKLAMLQDELAMLDDRSIQTNTILVAPVTFETVMADEASRLLEII